MSAHCRTSTAKCKTAQFSRDSTRVRRAAHPRTEDKKVHTSFTPQFRCPILLLWELYAFFCDSGILHTLGNWRRNGVAYLWGSYPLCGVSCLRMFLPAPLQLVV